MSGDLCIAILPLAMPGVSERAETGDLARGLAATLESRLRLVRSATVYVQHLIFAPEGETGKKGFLVRTSMWSLDEALGLPNPDGVTPTHLLHGSVTWEDEIRLTLELIDTSAAFVCFREEITVAPAEFIVRFHELIGHIAEASGAPLTPQLRQAIERKPTTSFDAFLQYMTGVSRTIALQVPVPAKEARRTPFHYFLEAMRTDPMYTEPLLALNLLARRWLQDSSMDGAMAVWALREACNLTPGFTPLKGTLGRRLFQEGHFDEARVLLEEYIRLHPETEEETAAAIVCLAAIYRTLNSPDAALSFLQSASRRFPSNADILECYGVSLLEAGDEEEAEACWRQVLEDEPRRPISLSNLGALLLGRGDSDRARILLERAVESPEATEFEWRRLIEFLLSADDIDAADEHATHWAETKPDSWRAWLKLAIVRHQRGDDSAARYALDKADNLKGRKDLDSEVARARLRIISPDDYRAYEEALATTPPQPIDAEDSHPEHLRVLGSLAQRYRTAPFLWSALSEKYREAGLLDSAIAAQTQATRLVPRSADAQNALGVLLLSDGQTQKAILRFREATRLAPGSAEYRLNLVSGLVGADRLLEAERHIDWLRTNSPEAPELVELTSKVRERARERALEDFTDETTGGGALRRLLRRLGRSRPKP